jgi:hypothetical protein
VSISIPEGTKILSRYVTFPQKRFVHISSEGERKQEQLSSLRISDVPFEENQQGASMSSLQQTDAHDTKM